MFPERGKSPSVGEAGGVEEIPQMPELPEHIEKAGVAVRPTQFTAQVKQRGKNLIQTPQSQSVTITLPTDQATLTTLAKGPITNALTWLAAFWLRMLKKAAFYGWKVVTHVRRNSTNS